MKRTVLVAAALAACVALGGIYVGSHTLSASSALRFSFSSASIADLSETSGKSASDARDWRISVRGDAYWGGTSNARYDSVGIMYMTEDAHRAFTSVNVGSSKVIHGRAMIAFLLDDQNNDNHGSLAVTATEE